MSSDLFLVTYRRHERELERRLEHQRVARERAAALAPGATATPGARTAVAGSLLARTAPAAALHRGLRYRARAWVVRGRDAAREATAPTACCSPA